MLAEAVLAAMTSAPKELTQLCTMTFEMLKTTDCSPAGRPIWIMRSASDGCSRSWRRLSRAGPVCRMRQTRISTTDTYCETTVAMATPATSSRQTMTKNRLRKTFNTPETARNSSGRFVSP